MNELLKRMPPVTVQELAGAARGSKVTAMLGVIVEAGGCEHPWENLAFCWEPSAGMETSLADLQEQRRQALTMVGLGPHYPGRNFTVPTGQALDAAFNKQCGEGADPDEWEFVVLKGWWMRETIVPAGRAESGVVFIDTTFYFQRKEL